MGGKYLEGFDITPPAFPLFNYSDGTYTYLGMLVKVLVGKFTSSMISSPKTPLFKFENFIIIFNIFMKLVLGLLLFNFIELNKISTV